jgi:large subunit ribosomal protein L1
MQAVEVASPNNAYELFIKTEIKSGIAVPKGRVNLPREAKPSSEEKILVFAEGRQAEEAKKAGAHIIGGTELVDGVSDSLFDSKSLRIYCLVPDCEWPRSGDDNSVYPSPH